MQKIMFDDKYELTKAVLDRTKTMTRRTEKLDDMESFIGWHTGDVKNDEYFRSFAYKDKQGNTKSHRYKVGEVIAVAQSYKNAGYGERWIFQGDVLDADADDPEWRPDFCRYYGEVAGWGNKMFVRPDLMPHQVKITGIKIERLQDISDEDCLKEGIYEETDFDDYDCDNTWYSYYADDAPTFDTPQEAYASLINAISGKGTWERNPWVVCYSFELIK